MSAPEPTSSNGVTEKIRRRIWLIEAYWFFNRSCSRVIDEFRRHFPNDPAPTNATVLRNVKKFHDNGTAGDLCKASSGRPSSSVNEENVGRVEEFFSENPTTSTRRASQALGIPRSSLQRIVKSKLKLYPYKVQTFQEITSFDMARRFEFADQMLNKILDHSIDLGKIWFSDEAHFWLSGYVNKQNYRFWGKENPRIFSTTSMKPERITVWCALSEVGIIGPVFIRENVTGKVYKRILLNKFIPFAGGMDAVEGHWFMQDGALPHRTNEVFEILNEHFSGRVIGLGYPTRFNGGLDWPPYSPDLNPCDFFLWGYLKDKVYRDSPATIDELQEAIIREIQSIPDETRINVIRGFESRLHAIMEKEGSHIEPYLH